MKPEGKNESKKKSMGKCKVKTKFATYNIVSASSRESDSDVLPYSDSKKEAKEDPLVGSDQSFGGSCDLIRQPIPQKL